MEADRILSGSEIVRVINGAWSGIDSGMMDMIADRLKVANVTLADLRLIMQRVAMVTSFKPGLKEFARFIKRRRPAARSYEAFGLMFPDCRVLDKFNRCYQRADYQGCIDLLLEREWGPQDRLANNMIGGLAIMEKEKLTRKAGISTEAQSNIADKFRSLKMM